MRDRFHMVGLNEFKYNELKAKTLQINYFGNVSLTKAIRPI